MNKGKLFVGLVLVLIGLFILLGNLELIMWNRVLLQLLFLVIGAALSYYGIKRNGMLTSGIGAAIAAMALVKLLPLLRITALGWDQLWPFLLIFIGFAWTWIFMKSNHRIFLFWGLVSFCIGILFLLSTVGIISPPPGDLLTKGWPIIIIATGIYILSKK